METQENPESQKSLEKGEQSWKNHVLSHQTLLQSGSDQNITILAKKKKKTHKFMEQDRQSRNKLMHVWPMNLQQKKEEYTIEKRQPSINGAGKTGQQRVKSKIETFSNTLYKIKLKWIKDLNVRLDTIKLLKEKIGRILFDLN